MGASEEPMFRLPQANVEYLLFYLLKCVLLKMLENTYRFSKQIGTRKIRQCAFTTSFWTEPRQLTLLEFRN